MAGLPVESGFEDSHVLLNSVSQHEETTINGNGNEKKAWIEHGPAMEDLSFIMFGDLDETEAKTKGGVDVARIHWSQSMTAHNAEAKDTSKSNLDTDCQRDGCDDSKMQLEATEHLNSSDGPPLFLGQLKQASTVSQTKIMRLMTLQIESGYHSSMDKTGKFDVYYNLQGDREPEIKNEVVILKFNWQSLSFSYNLVTGRASYLLACSNTDFEYYKRALSDRKLPAGRYPHPFSIHLILLFEGVLARNEELEDLLRRLLLLEDRSIYRRSKVTFESGDDTKGRLQELHSLLKELLIRDNSNKRYIASIESLILDLARLQKTIKSTAGTFQIDDFDHQRMLDGFHCLKTFCLDRERRIATRLQRVQNLIALTYNLLANRDSITSHRIAHEARQDGAAMKTIALVTMLFFPATFVSSFLGTNLVTLDVGADGRTRFVFSHLWWIYLVSAIPLTIMTLLAWLYFVKRRSRKERAKWQSAGGVKHGGGTCEKTGNCVLSGFNLASYCPNDPNDVECCVKKTCSTPKGSGTCINTADKGSCKGAMVPGYCPGDDTIQCCVPGASTPSPSPGGSGAGIVAAAVKEEGIDYVWGGGGCSGPSKGGFDCSGLTQYAICQALHKTIPRTAQTQYHSSMGKQIPRAQAKAGDLIFWATGGDCANSVAHVGIFMRDGWMVNAAHTGTPVREQSIWTSSGGESICPNAVRVAMSQPEILVHVAAPSHGPDDVRYRREALAILGFEAVERYNILGDNVIPTGTAQTYGNQTSQATQQSQVQAQDSITSTDPAPRHQFTDTFSTWLTPIFSRSSPQILVGQTPGPLHLKPASGLPGQVHVEETPSNQQRQRIEPSELSIIRETPPLRRPFADAFETPPSEIPDSQPTAKFGHHGERAFQESGSPSPSQREGTNAKRWKGDNEVEGLLGLGDGTPPDDTSTPLLDNGPQASPITPDADVIKPPPSSSAFHVSQTKMIAYRRRKVDPPPPETSLNTTIPSQLTPSLKVLRQHCTKILEAVQRRRPIQNRERGHWRLTFQFDDDDNEAPNNEKWNQISREKMWAWLHNFISKGCGGWGTWAIFEEGKLQRFDGEDGWIGELGEQEQFMGPDDGPAVGRVKIFCWGEVVLEIYALLILATHRRVKKCGAQWVDSYGKAVVVVGNGDQGAAIYAHVYLDAAMKRVGGQTVILTESYSSTQKGKSLEDTVRTVGQYTDAIVLRHGDENAVDAAALVSPVPIINGGNGAKEHPTQGLLDLLTILEELGTINGLTITFVEELSTEVVKGSDVIYCIRVQKERFTDLELYEKVKDSFTVGPSVTKGAKSNMILMHPLPRNREVTLEVDQDPRAAYCKQKNDTGFEQPNML
ncbi:MAG: hypothetical protein Q9213_007531 [Squamulea squamosa]